LIHRLLAFSRRQTLAPKVVNPNLGSSSEMEELVRRTVGPEIHVEAALTEAHPWPILCDPNQLENALLNLCINARDAMPDGGSPDDPHDEQLGLTCGSPARAPAPPCLA
jgi:signal transduction histidine kinase